MPVLQALQLEGLLQGGEVAVEVPHGAKFHNVRIVHPPKGAEFPPIITVVCQFDAATKLTVTRSFVLIPDAMPFIDSVEYVGSIHFVDKKGVKFMHVCVEADRPAIATTETPERPRRIPDAKEFLSRIPRPGHKS